MEANAAAKHHMHKNRLQEYTQKSGLPIPNYKVVNEGFPHSPMFRAMVVVDGTEYTSKHTFLHRKSAEQEVARFALDCITKKMKNDGGPLITHRDPMASKAILNEFAIKKNMTIPKYTTTCPEGPGTIFISSLMFDGKIYKGEVAGSKKMAEQLAARTAIDSLLDSDLGITLCQIIKSKSKLSPLSNSPKDLVVAESILPIAGQTESSSGNFTITPPPVASLSSLRGMMDYCSKGKRHLEMDNSEMKRLRMP